MSESVCQTILDVLYVLFHQLSVYFRINQQVNFHITLLHD